MIRFKGYGLLVILVDYCAGIYLLREMTPRIFVTERQQYIILFTFHIFITIFNYLLIRFLNRKEVKHTVFELRLEYVVLFLGGILLVNLIMMGKDIFS